MKIIQVSSYYPPHLGGGDNVAREISEHLANKGHEVQVFTSNIGCKANKLKSKKNLKLNYLNSFEIAHASIIYSLFFKLMSIPRDSIIHLHVGHGFVPEIVYLVSKIIKVPYVAHYHLESVPTGKFGILLPLYKRIFLKRVLQNAAAIIVPTIDYIDVVHKKYSVPKKRITVIPNGINLSKFLDSPKKVNNKIKSILFVGRLTSQKNIPTLIESFKKVLINNDKLELHIVGDGEDRSKIKDLIAKEKLNNNVILHGLLRGKKLYTIYKNSDLFILPSKYESFGIVLIEAMASGLPIIASNIHAVRNVIKDKYTGLLVKPSIENVVKAIETYTKDSSLRNKVIKNGLKEVSKFSWNKIIPLYENIYDHIFSIK